MRGIQHELSPSSELHNRLIGALIGLARATDGNEHLISHASTAVILESLIATLGDEVPEDLLARVEQEKRNMVPDCFTCACPCGKNNDYDMELLWNAHEDIRSLKLRILSAIRDMAGHVHLGQHEEAVERFFYKALIVIGMDCFGVDDLLPIVQEADEMRKKCAARMEKYGMESGTAPETI